MQVRILRVQPPGRGGELVQSGVDTAGLREDRGGQRVGVGGFEFGALAVFEETPDDFVFRPERDEGLFVSSVLAGPGFLRRVGDLQAIEQDFAELFR